MQAKTQNCSDKEEVLSSDLTDVKPMLNNPFLTSISDGFTDLDPFRSFKFDKSNEAGTDI